VRTRSKTGRERKYKRSVKKGAEKDVREKLPEVWTAANEREARENNQLIRQALRWNTDATSEDVAGQNPKKLKAREVAILVTRRNMLSPDSAVANAAVRNLIAMEGQNQGDDKKQAEPQQHLHLHAGPVEYEQATNDSVIKALELLEDLKDARN